RGRWCRRPPGTPPRIARPPPRRPGRARPARAASGRRGRSPGARPRARARRRWTCRSRCRRRARGAAVRWCGAWRRRYGRNRRHGRSPQVTWRSYRDGVDPLELLITNDVLRAMDLLGVFVMGVAAGALASRLNFDAVGFAVIGIAAGLGGGIVRDLVLDFGVP